MAGKERLTSRERVVKALNHQEADRVPLDLGGFQTGIHKKAYEELIEYLGFNEEIVILDPVQQLAKPSEAVLERFHIDTRYVCAHGPDSFTGGIEHNVRAGRGWYDLKDEFGVVWSMPEDNGLYMDISHHPLADAVTKDIAEYPFPKGDDLAGQDGPLFSVDFYKRVVKPRQKKLVQHIRSHTDAKIWYHTCGGCVPLMAELIDNGIDIINPVQISAAGMEPEYLKKQFGGDVVFWGGGIDSQHILPFASPEEVKDEIRKNLGTFKAGGGYIF